MIESFYDKWYEIWAPEIGEGHCKSLVEVQQARINHCTSG